MRFRELAERSTTHIEPNIEPLLSELLCRVLANHNFIAGLLCHWEEGPKATVIAGHGIPIEPFNGAKNRSLTTFIEECIGARCASRLHRFTNCDLRNDIEHITHLPELRGQAAFIPAFSGDNDFVILGFGSADNEMEIQRDLILELLELVDLSTMVLSAKESASRIKTIELYVREVGHDLASSAQAILAKLRNISRGFFQGKAAIAKVREAEQELMAAYRAADTLGVTVDPDYNLSMADTFDLSSAIREVIELCRSEAEERHITLNPVLPENQVEIWGDQRALQSAITQLVLNAIKYAKGSSRVTVKLQVNDTNVIITVIDRGTPINDDERPHLWDFGWRGERAKELHVNGSGIGLYTVRKIVRAHGGRCGADKHESKPDQAIFYIVIPKEKGDSKMHC